MKNYFDEINKKLTNELKIENINIVDNSHKHKSHKFYSAEKFHLHLKIKSLYQGNQQLVRKKVDQKMDWKICLRISGLSQQIVICVMKKIQNILTPYGKNQDPKLLL